MRILRLLIRNTTQRMEVHLLLPNMTSKSRFLRSFQYYEDLMHLDWKFLPVIVLPKPLPLQELTFRWVFLLFFGFACISVDQLLRNKTYHIWEQLYVLNAEILVKKQTPLLLLNSFDILKILTCVYWLISGSNAWELKMKPHSVYSLSKGC